MRIAIIDDQDDIKYATERILQKENHTCYGFCGDEDDLIEGLTVFDVELIILDMRLKDSLTGLDVLQRLRAHNLQMPVIMITAYTTPSNMIEASKMGIIDIIKKPFSAKELLDTVSKYQPSIAPSSTPIQGKEQLIGSFASMKDIYKYIGIASENSRNVFLHGETGTGKEIVARMIHENSSHKMSPFIAINCATIPENMFEKLMYGRTGALFKNNDSSYKGYVQEAEDGTLFFDKIGELAYESQAKMLRFLETKKYYPLGASKEVTFQGRIICSSLKTPQMLLDDKFFRNDLYYIISPLEIAMPNLEMRKQDLQEFAEFFITEYNKKLHLHCQGIEKDALEFLRSRSYKGNVREFKNIIYKAMATSRADMISLDILQHILFNDETQANPLIDDYCTELLKTYGTDNSHALMIDFETALIRQLLQQVGNLSHIATSLSISRNTLKEKIKRYHLEDMLPEKISKRK